LNKKFKEDNMLKVVQCWDDGVVNDIRLCELLRKYQAKATFNLNPGLHQDSRISTGWAEPFDKNWSHKGYRGGKVGIKEMVEVYGDFQVASHCWCHETVGRVPDNVFIQAAIDARKFLEDMFQRECPGFAWPCGAYSPETIQLMRDAGFAYGRTTKNTSDVCSYTEPMMLCPSCHFQDNNFWQAYEDAKKTGVFYFWGHSYEMFEYDPLWKQFEDKVRIISEDPDSVWCDVIDIVKN
jgi:peptidoglycan/xylan/chitin deacetylase (PgdA/CDA1 family)